jgi:hypothetical protein
MNVIRPGGGKNGDEGQTAAAAQVEGELGELIRRDIAPLRRPQLVEPNANGDAAVSHVNSLIDRVSGGSVKEIERLIAELQALRDFLLNEGQRVQREITGYAQMSQSAISSTKIMVESVAKWKVAIETARKPASSGGQ